MGWPRGRARSWTPPCRTPPSSSGRTMVGTTSCGTWMRCRNYRKNCPTRKTHPSSGTNSFQNWSWISTGWNTMRRGKWGKVYLHTEVHGGYNQRFLRDSQGNIICLGTESEPRWDLRLDVIADDPTEAENGTKVGCYTQEKSGNQKWDFVYVGED